jgi:antitoxin (DNA-binding transcriptional repressor) of toxin-antitoxin stability system
MQITNISEAKASLSRLIQLVQETNEPIIIGKAGKPVAVLSVFKEEGSPRKLGGSWEGRVEIAEDFDEPDDMLVDSFYDAPIIPEK